ncbi:MAG: NAD(+)/NADH kinase [Chthoniobacterales bacterium]
MIGLLAHSEKANARELVATLCAELDARSAPYLLESHTADLIDRTSDLDEYELAKLCDLLVVMGGDGTILRMVHRVRDQLRPIFGINIGSLGFLTCLGPQEASRAVEAILANDFLLSRRHLLKVDVVRPGADSQTFFALNDVVITGGEPSRLVRIHVDIDGETLTDYNADGLIIATPTGSTAYSLSAGGPILLPSSGVTVVTPICPHVLTNRTVVVKDTSRLEASLVVEDQQVFVTIDGQASVELNAADVIHVTKSDRVLPLAMLPERPFTEVLRQKLKWSGSNV